MPPSDPDAPLVRLTAGTEPDRALLGGKASSLVRLLRLGARVPPAFTLTTAAHRDYRDRGRTLSDPLWTRVRAEVDRLGELAGERFGGIPPLLVSVRSGAPVSMPGMMDTLLNLGLSRRATRSLAGRPEMVTELAAGLRADLAGSGLPVLVAEHPDAVRAELEDQLRWAVCRVFDSWHSDRAGAYRRANGVPDDLGTAVTVQVMVFGNRDERSGTGVHMTRDPVTGAPVPYGEWLPHAQGEAIVSGERTPLPLAALERSQPEAYAELVALGRRLERAAGTVQEIEFTVESGRLHLLQARASTSSAAVAVRWAVDLVDEGVIDVAEALRRVPAERLPRPGSGPQTGPELARGIGVCDGIGSGLAVTDADEADRIAGTGRPVVLVRPSTSPRDVVGFLAAAGIVTERGGATSHAAVVSRQLGVPCVVACGAGTSATLAGRVVTVDGSTGTVHDGLPLTYHGDTMRSPQLDRLLSWRADRKDEA